MDTFRKFLMWRNADDDVEDGCDDNVVYGPTINISPGQVKEEVHYIDSRGTIDLSYLRFYADDVSKREHSRLDSDIQNITTNIRNGDADLNYNNDEGSTGWAEAFIDIAVFEVPEHCTSRNCDLSKFGVGSLIHLNGASYLGLCQAGRLQLDYDVFEGHHTQLMIPSEGPMPDRIKHRKNYKFTVPKNRHCEVMLANCNRKGRRMHVAGQVVFELVEGDAVINNLTAESLMFLLSLAFMVFALLTSLAIRINWGTRSDFEEAHYAIVSGSDEAEQ